MSSNLFICQTTFILINFYLIISSYNLGEGFDGKDTAFAPEALAATKEDKRRYGHYAIVIYQLGIFVVVDVDTHDIK